MNEGWVGFDLDGTLAKYVSWNGPQSIGEPIKSMIEILKKYLSNGWKCKIFIARAYYGIEATTAIHKWLKNQGLPELEVTNIKDFAMAYLYDDRCVVVETNTGKILGGDFFSEFLFK